MNNTWNIVGKILPFLFCFFLVGFQSVSAVDFDEDISDEDKATFDKILEPVVKVYNLVKYTGSVVAVLVLLIAGITFMISGSNAGKRDKAKNMIMYVVVGLIVVWAAPTVVNFVL